MGSSLSQSSKRESNTSSNTNSSNHKESRGSKPKFASPENRVLPNVTNGPQRLRSTDNGNILHSGGTISGRKTNIVPSSNGDTEFTRFLQKKCQSYQTTPSNISYQTLFGHRKSHSDPDIVRKMMEENETEEDDDGRLETESNPNQRSIIALSPSKAKIKSRKKKKAPEPPQANTLPRTVTGRNSFKCESQELSKYNATYESTEAPRRPLPPIPLDEMPPPPPPPPPDYNRTIDEREVLKTPGKSFQKNRRIVDKWKFSKPNFEYFAERRQRSKSLDRTEDVKLRDKELSSSCDRFDRNYSLRNIAHREDSTPQWTEEKEKSSKSDLHDAIIAAAKKRAERLARTRMCRNLSFRSSMSQPYDVEADDTGQVTNGSAGTPSKEKSAYDTDVHIRNFRNLHSSRDEETYIKETMKNNIGNLESRQNGIQGSFHDKSDLSSRTLQNPVPLENSYVEQKKSFSNKNVNGFAREPRNSYDRAIQNSQEKYHKDTNYNRQPYLANQTDLNVKSNGEIYVKERPNPRVNHDTYHRNANDNTLLQYINEQKYSVEQKKARHTTEPDHCRNSHPRENTEEHHQSRHSYPFGVTKQTDNSHCRPETENHDNDVNHFSRNLSRIGGIHKRSQDNAIKNSLDCGAKSEENLVNTHVGFIRTDLGMLPPLPNDKQTKRNSKPQEPIIPFLTNGTLSSSSVSEEEMEINLQLRPTLPRRPVDIPRFSPTDVWKSINLDFFKSHQHRSDVSSEDGEDIMEEKIHRINRPVAPRRLIHDRSGDSGISPDAGSPMFLNENFESPVITNTVLCSSPNVASNEDLNTTWIPQQDLEESECGSDTSPENKFNVTNEVMQPKFSMPNLMFPSRSLPRTDNKNGTEERIVPEKEKTRSRDKRRRGLKNNETQHFNSLRNLKRALGIRSKTTIVDVNGLDSNWSLSRSLPNFENVNNLDAKTEIEVPEVSVTDNIRRSNSESRMVHQENGRMYSIHSSQNKNPEWRKSFPGQSSDGHVIYLPEYCSTTLPCQISLRNDDANCIEEISRINKDDLLEQMLNLESLEKKQKCKKKFSYQSTVRQLEKKKLEEQLSKEIEEKEKKRETEIEWMNIVEDEFRKQRNKEKSDVKQRLRIYALEVNKQNKSSSGNALQNFTDLTVENIIENGVKVYQEDVQNSSGITSCTVNRDDFLENVHTIRKEENFSTSHDSSHISSVVQQYTQSYDSKTDRCLQDGNSSVNFTHVQKNIVPDTCATRNTSSQNNFKRNEQMINARKKNPNMYVDRGISKTNFPQKGVYNGNATINEREISICRNAMNEKDVFNSTVEDSFIGQCSVPENNGNTPDLPKNMQRHYIVRESNTVAENSQRGIRDKDIGFVHKNSFKNQYILGDTQRLPSHQGPVAVNKDQRFEKADPVNSAKSHQLHSSSFDEHNDRRHRMKSNDASFNKQQPTGMKKWLRRQNRDHLCHENMPRPEPEGGRSSDECKHMDGKRELINDRSQPIGANFPDNFKCSHGNGYLCSICNHYNNHTNGYPRNGAPMNMLPKSPINGRMRRSEKTREDRDEIHPKPQISNGNGAIENHLNSPVGSPYMRESVEEYELHTRLCRTNSGRTFESHSYYALERRKEDPSDYESNRKNNPVEDPQNNFFSTTNFEKELKENVRRKSRDFEKRTRNHQPCNYDSDDSGSDHKEVRYQRHNPRNLKKKSVSEHREASFSRNHPHRNGARMKAQTNGHFINGRTPNGSTSNHPSAMQQRLPNSGLL